MSRFENKREQLSQQTADFILDKGLLQLSFRVLAKHVNTSDRMLLHYFKDKNDLINAGIEAVYKRMLRDLENANAQLMSAYELLEWVYWIIRQDQMKAYLNLWFELIACKNSANQESEFYAQSAKKMMQLFVQWVEQNLALGQHTPQEHQAHSAWLTLLIEGMVMLEQTGLSSEINQALKWHLKVETN